MSLIKLLAVGRSIIGMKRHGSLYRELPDFLPKFGRSAGIAASVEISGRETENLPNLKLSPQKSQPGIVCETLPLFKPAAASNPKTAASGNIPFKESVPKVPSTDVSETPARTLRIRPWQMFERSPRGPFVQEELALEKIRVVRNDLSESDLEVGPALKERQDMNEPATSKRNSGSPNQWGRLAVRLLEAVF